MNARRIGRRGAREPLMALETEHVAIGAPGRKEKSRRPGNQIVLVRCRAGLGG